jgi:O-antigen/teichoic acid export membrane protein
MNALYLMLSTFILGVCGFIFWVIVTRTHDVAAVGLATTLLSVSGLVSLLGLVGFDTTLVRFLPSSDRKNDYINTGLIIALLASISLSVCLGIILPILSPSLSILVNPWVFISFVFFTAVTSLNTLTNSVFLAYKQARYVMIITVLFSVFKILLPLFVVSGGAVAIFSIAGVAQLFGLILSIMWMRRRFGYKISPVLHMSTLRNAKKFSSSILVSNGLSLLPPTLLPLIILYQSDAKNVAYYYIALTISSALYTIVYASMQSVLVEGSHNATAIRIHIIGAIKLITLLLIPTILLTIFAGNRLLSIFGNEYAEGAGVLLQLLAINTLPITLYTALTTTFKVRKKVSPVIIMNALSAIITLSLGVSWFPQLGLTAVGWAWIIGNTAACGVGTLVLIRHKRRRESYDTVTERG